MRMKHDSSACSAQWASTVNPHFEYSYSTVICIFTTILRNTVRDPLRLGPAFAPSAFVRKVEHDIAAENRILHVRPQPVKG